MRCLKCHIKLKKMNRTEIRDSQNNVVFYKCKSCGFFCTSDGINWYDEKFNKLYKGIEFVNED